MWACAHDPVFSEADAVLLASFGVRASQHGSGDCCGSGSPGTPALGPIVFFMPHCPWALYAKVLAACEWTAPGILSEEVPHLNCAELCIVGNSFSTYGANYGDEFKAALSASSFMERARTLLDATEGPEARPAADADTILYVLGMIRSGDLHLDETRIDSPAARRDHFFADSLSCTSLHTFSF
jgi:hypothetical protein